MLSGGDAAARKREHTRFFFCSHGVTPSTKQKHWWNEVVARDKSRKLQKLST